MSVLKWVHVPRWLQRRPANSLIEQNANLVRTLMQYGRRYVSELYLGGVPDSAANEGARFSARQYLSKAADRWLETTLRRPRLLRLRALRRARLNQAASPFP